MKTDVIVIILALLAIAVAISALFALGHQSLAMTACAGLLASFAYISIGFLSVSRSLTKPGNAFYKAFYKGLILRFVLFILTLVLIYKFSTMSITAFALSFILFYVFFQSIEIRLIWKKLEKQKSHQECS